MNPPLPRVQDGCSERLTDEQIAAFHRDATWSKHVLEAMRLAQRFPDFTPEQLHYQWLIEVEGYGIDPDQSVVPPVREPLPSWAIEHINCARHYFKEYPLTHDHGLYHAVALMADQRALPPEHPHA